MKKGKFLLLSIGVLSLSSCVFDWTRIPTVISSITVDVDQKERVVDDVFDVDDVKVILRYSNNLTKEIEYKNFYDNNIDCYFIYPGYTELTANKTGSYLLNPTDAFEITSAGQWTVYATYETSAFTILDGKDYFNVDEKIVEAEKLIISENSLALVCGETYQLSYDVVPSNVTSTVVWETNDSSVATVNSDGLVTAVEEGQCLIKARIDNLVKECVVTVNPLSEDNYIFINEKFETEIGNWEYSSIGSSFDKQNGLGVRISSETTITSNKEFDSISSIFIKASTSRNSVGQISIYIGDVLIDTGYMNSSNRTYTGEFPVSSISGPVKLVINPESSSMFGFMTNPNIYLSCVSIKYNSNPIFAESIEIDGSSSIEIGGSEKLKVNYNPISTNQRTLEWSSSNEEVLSVTQDGTILGLQKGTANILLKVKTKDFYISTSKTIEVIEVPVERIEAIKDSIEVHISSTQKITTTIYPTNASYKELIYSSENPNIATVDNSGNIVGQSLGKTTITVSSEKYPSVSCNIQVTVTLMPEVKPTTMKYTTKQYSESNYYTTDSAPTLGEVRFLVVPIWFTDSTNYIDKNMRESVREDIENAYFGSQSDTGWQSVKSYYEDLSDGAVNISGTVTDWYECGDALSKYSYSNGSKTPDPTCSLVKKAVDWYFDNNKSDSRKNYDQDSNGYLDGVLLIYASPDYNAAEDRGLSNLQDNLWAYTYWLQSSASKDVSNPGPNVFFWASYDFMYSSGTQAYKRTGKGRYGSGDNSKCSIDTHTYIHEMGHIFGLEDYYDYSRQYYPAGGFSMQDYNTGCHDPFSTILLGWGKTYVPKETCDITIKPFQEDHEVILLSPDWNKYDSPFDEYLLIELFTPTGLNAFDCTYNHGTDIKGPNKTGIRLWHVDSRLVQLSGGKPVSSTAYTYPINNCYYMFSNSYYSSTSSTRISVLGREYSDYNLLQLIRNDVYETYTNKTYLTENSLFTDGSSFDMTTFRRQFKNSGLLNSKKELGWSFKVSINGNNENAEAVISLTKN